MNTALESRTSPMHARSLLTAINDASARYFPRREIIVEWLEAYLARTPDEGAVIDDEKADLVALDRYLRSNHVTVARDSAG